MNNRNDLIRQLSANFQSDIPNQVTGKNRFHENTQTLMSDKDMIRHEQIAAEQKKESRYEMSLETDQYGDIILGRRTFLILKDIGFVQGDSIVIREFENLKPTGNMVVKIINFVEKESSGIKEGYCVVSW